MNNNVIIDESAKQILIENIYKGKGYINTLDPVPVETYAEMQVSSADTIIPENIKKDETLLGVTGTYDGKVGLTFNTVPATWGELGHRNDPFPFFKFTNIFKELETNHHYAVAEAEYNFNLGDIVVTEGTPEDHDNFVYIQEPGKLVLDYSNSETGQTDFDIWKYYDEDLDDDVNIYNINLYIIEATDVEGEYKIVDKGNGKINALFPIGPVIFNSFDDPFSVRLLKDDQIIETLNAQYGEQYFKKSIYGETYKVEAFTNDNDYTLWGIFDDYSERGNLQLKPMKPEEFSTKGFEIYTTTKGYLRTLHKTGDTSFTCKCWDKIVEDGEELVGKTKLYLRINHDEVEGQKCIFTLTNESSGESYTYVASYDYEEKGGYYDVFTNYADTDAGSRGTVITINCEFITPIISTYIKEGDVDEFDLWHWTNPYEYDPYYYDWVKVENGSTLIEGEIYLICGQEYSHEQLPEGATIRINDQEIIYYEDYYTFTLTANDIVEGSTRIEVTTPQ